MTSRKIKTDGAAYIEGEVKTDGGDFTGRDKNVVTDVDGNVHIGDIFYQKTAIEEFREALEKRIDRHTIDLLQKFRKAERAQPDEPYRHLNFFDLEHKNIFFGRRDALQNLVSLIFADNHLSQLTLVHAPSGAGKTSLLRVMQPELQEKDALPFYIFHPQEPARTIKQTIFPDSPHPDILENLPLRTFLSWVCEPLQKSGLSLILILDQFEEFFIQLPEEMRQLFIVALKDCYDAENLPVKFILAMRKDYFSDMDQFKIKSIYDNRFLLPPLTRAEARESIEGPIQEMNVSWEEASVERLLNYLQRGEMDPPQLQLICATRYEQLYKKEGQEILTVSDEDLQTIYSDFLRNVMDVPDDDPKFPKTQRDLGWRLLKKHLTTSQKTKVSVPLDVLYEKVALKSELDPVIDYLVDNRILRRDIDSIGQTTVEITHDTLAEEIAGRETEQESLEKQAHELVNRELTVWLHFNKSSEYLMNKNSLKILKNYADYLKNPSADMLTFLLRSAVVIGFDADYWFQQASGNIDVEAILLEYVQGENFRERLISLRLLDQIEGDYLSIFLELLSDEYPQIRSTVITQLEKRYPSGEWRESLEYERYIPAGNFIMGDLEEAEYKEIFCEAYYIDRYPVTNTDYERYKVAIGENFDVPENKEAHPVVNVSVEDAKAYAEWAGRRLLNVSEWEKAATWNDMLSLVVLKKRIYPWGKLFMPEYCATIITHEDTAPIGGFSENGDSACGVADLAGNVWEWTNSQFSLEHLPKTAFSIGTDVLRGIGFSEFGPYGDGNVSFSHFLFGLIFDRFNQAEFQSLCDDLDIRYEDLPGRSFLCKVRELIKRCQDNHNLDELIIAIGLERPDVIDELEIKQWEVQTNLDEKNKILHWILVHCFNDNELLDLCFDYFPNFNYILPVPHEGRASELINYLEYYGWMGHLDKELQRLRPKVIEKFVSFSEEKQLTLIRSRPGLKEKMIETFNFDKERIEECCEDLGFSLDEVSLNGVLNTKVREFILYLERRHFLSDLGHYLENNFPSINWDNFFEISQIEELPMCSIEVNEFVSDDINKITLAGKVRKLLLNYFFIDDLQGLTYELGIYFDNLSRNNTGSIARALAQYCEQNGMLIQLTKGIYELKPYLFKDFDEVENLLKAIWQQQLLSGLFQEMFNYVELADLSFDLNVSLEIVHGDTLGEKIESLVYQFYCVGALDSLARICAEKRPSSLWSSPDENQFLLSAISQNFNLFDEKTNDIYMVKGGSYKSFSSATSCYSKSAIKSFIKADNLGFRVGFSLP